VIELAVFTFGRSPGFPAVRFVENVAVFLAVERRFIGAILFQAVEVFQEQQPGGCSV